VLAVLYVALIELLLLDSARELSEARRFRARVVAATLAENGAELAAAALVSNPSADVNTTDEQGSISGMMRKTDETHFRITGDGTTSGLIRTSAHVDLQGRIEGTSIKIEYAVHTP